MSELSGRTDEKDERLLLSNTRMGYRGKKKGKASRRSVPDTPSRVCNVFHRFTLLFFFYSWSAAGVSFFSEIEVTISAFPSRIA